MSAAKHTPGPWVLADRNKKGFAARIISGDPNSGIVADAYGGGEMAQVDANAKLIAAAPELADAVEMLLKRIAGDCTREEADAAPDNARSALRKAGRL